MKEKLSGELKPSPLSERCLARMDLSNEDPTFGKQSTSGAPTDVSMSQRRRDSSNEKTSNEGLASGLESVPDTY